MDIYDHERPVSLDHIRNLTDCFGIIQHADHALPNYRFGYTTDDNARALTVSARHYRLFGDKVSQQLAGRYLAFLSYAQIEDGRFLNFFGYDRRPLEEVGSEDSFGRTLAALAYILYAPPQIDMSRPAERLLCEALPWIGRLIHPRAKAYSINALYWWGQADPEHREQALRLVHSLAGDLLDNYQIHSNSDWRWFLPEMTHANAYLPQALFIAYQVTGEEKYRTVASEAMEFLCQTVFRGNILAPIGNNGWYGVEDRQPAEYDQQPIEAAAMVDACLAAYEATDNMEYLRLAWRSLQWFFGNNALGLSLYDAQTGGCFDGLMETGVNRNRGAESTLSMILAQLTVLEARQQITSGQLGHLRQEATDALTGISTDPSANYCRF